MPKPLPFPIKPKNTIPADDLPVVETPQPQPPKAEKPTESKPNTIQPEKSPLVETTPEESKPIEKTPNPSPEKTEMPSDLNEENVVVIDGQKIEIKPTKLKYFRNKGASAYGIIKAIPLHELLTYGKGVIDKERDADQLLYDFLVSVFDDSTFVRDHYDNLDADQIERIVKIFGRLNHIDEKEEAARKNKEAQVKR